jgi:small nuclear ribonucleoprotein (snRNP)-like protein
LQIQVALNNQNNQYEGMLEHYDLHYNIALVSIKNYPDVCPLNTLVDWNKSFEVAAVGRCFESGVLMATSGDMVSWSGTLDCEFIVRSTSKISKVILYFVAKFFMMIVNTSFSI